ncbi:MAG: ketopantoate reductase family protein [Proteobacteria bacterium]|nr:ketopantoate reductase family protein [Pseudomonadota bacterium]MBU1387459.1 ketopantoate reductase family protein [Pseudomonadota bacterium]MBU1541954.1 ketopantoate reductase family protein [Pseudomonadota bacterium]MBU2430896.1 ketopantoate reductase family protein [Pseudomonadota bacterium]MBU2479559.1 ketopantoate reductase family protein [Pseudomonadota bacterium]
MKFLIYGAGALGQAMGCMLKAGGHDVDLVLRQRFVQTIVGSGLNVTGIFGQFSASFSQDQLWVNLDSVRKNYDYILLTTKAYDTRTAIDDLLKISDRANAVVSMQNGCGNVELLKDAFGPEKIIGARIITGFEISSPGRITITVCADDIHVGPCTPNQISEKEIKLAEAICSAGHPCKVVGDIYQSLFSKLLYNCALNPLGAVLGVHYGLLVEHEETRNIMDAVIEETFAVIDAMGKKTDWPNANAYKAVFYDKLIPATYHHRPSMLQDLENHKPTEIDSLAGYISAQGRQLSVTTPACDMLVSLVKFKEKNMPDH